MPAPSLIKKLIKDFLEHIEIEKNRSANTIDNYAFYLKRFEGWAREHKITAPAQISLDSIRAYRLWLNRLNGDTPLKKNTQNYHLIAVRSFLKYLAKRDIRTLAPEKIELAKVPQRSVAFMEGDDLERFLQAPMRTHEPEIIKRRDAAILELFFSSGLRVSELAGLRRDSINLTKDEFTVKGKGDKYRIVFLSPGAKESIKNYLAIRTDTFNPLFIRHDRAFTGKALDEDDDNLHLTPRSMQRLVQKYSVSSGMTKHVTPHTMRHSFATDLLINGADIRSVQALLGHASITTTQIYTHITNQQLRDVHKAFHGKKRKR
ncbi:MAG: tyrosine-type recombinase/integrase [bacterium]|nr:tyrosine-type recombinase/integrase [bacterium]